MRLVKKMVLAGLSMLLALPLGNAYAAVAAQGTSGGPAVLDVQNDFVDVAVHRGDGRFSIRTKEGNPLKEGDNDKPLLFQGKLPDTSFTTFRINGSDYIYGNNYGFLGSDGIFTYAPATQGLSNQSEWTVKGLDITQTITLANDKTNPNIGNVKISYQVKNTTDAAVQVGSRILLDTMLGVQDASPLSVSGGGEYIRKETEFTGSLPSYWKATDDPLAPKIVAYGFLNGWGNASPNRMVVAHWDGIAATKWDYAVHKDLDFTSKDNEYGTADSALALYWDPASLAPGEQKVFETYYGLGSFYTSAKQAKYAAQLLAPKQLTLNAAQDGYNESPFEIKVDLDNATSGAVALTDMQATIGLPNELEPVPGETLTKSVGAVGVGESRTISWKVKPKPQTSYKAAQYWVGLQAAGGEQVVVPGFVVMPALSGKQPDVQVWDLLPNEVYRSAESPTILVKGKGFEALKGNYDVQVSLVRERDGQEQILSGLLVSDDKLLLVPLSSVWKPGEPPEPGSYRLRIDAGKYGVFEKPLELTDDEAYKSRTYGILAIVGDNDTYSIQPLESEMSLQQLKGQAGKRVLLEIRGSITQHSSGNNDTYEISPGATINSVVSFSEDKTLGDKFGLSQKITVQKYARDVAHGGDYIDVAGAGVLSIPSFPFMTGAYHIVFEDGKDYELEADESKDQSPVEIEWEASKWLNVLRRVAFLPLDIKNAVLGDGTISFGGSVSLNFGAMGEFNKLSSESGGTNGGTGNAGSSGSGGSAGGGGDDDDEDDLLDADLFKLGIAIDEARFGVKKKSDLFGAAGTFGLLGLRAEGEAGLPKHLVPGMDVGAEGRVAIDTIDGKYEVEADVKFKVVEVDGLLAIRFIDNTFPIIDNMKFVVGYEPGIPLIPTTPVAYITKAGGGISNIYDTLLGNFNVLPPLTLMLVGGFDVAKVVSGDDLTLALSMRGVSFSGDLDIVKLPILKHVYGSVQFEDSLEKFGVSVMAGANLDVFDVLVGDVYVMFAYDSSQHGLFGPVSMGGGGSIDLQVPKIIPLVGGLKLAGAKVDLSTEQVSGSVHFLDIPVGFKYIWGDSMPVLGANTAQGMSSLLAAADTTRGEGLSEGFATQSFNDQAGHPTGVLTYGTNITKVADSAGQKQERLVKASSAMTVAAGSPETQTIPIGRQDYALLEFDYHGDVPHLSLTDPDGAPYALQDGVNYRVQEIPADSSQSGTLEQRVYVTVTNPKVGNWTVTSDTPVAWSLMNVTEPPSLQSLTAAQTGDHTVRASWQADHAQDEKLALYLASDNGHDPGHLLASGIDPAAGSYDITLPDTLASGTYYIRGVLVKDGANVNSRYADGPIQIANPHQPPQPADVAAAAIGNGLFHVKWSESEAVDGYVLQLLDDAGKPVSNAGAIDVQGDSKEADIGGAFADSSGNPIGMLPGHSYGVSVTAYRIVNGVKVFGPSAVSASAYLPQPAPAKLQLDVMSADGTVSKAVDEKGQITYTVNRSQVQLKLSSNEPVDAFLQVNDAPATQHSGSTWEQTIDLQEGTNSVQVKAVNGSGDTALEGIRIISDTIAPDLKVESPSAFVVSSAAKMLVKGAAEAGSKVTVNGKPLAVSDTGLFEQELPMDGVLNQDVTIAAEDEAGNRSVYTTTAFNDSVDRFDKVEIRPAGTAACELENGSCKVTVGQPLSLELNGIDPTGHAYRINPADVKWSLLLGDSNGIVAGDGSLTATSEGEIVVKASYSVSRDYALESTFLAKAVPAGGSVPPGDSGHYEDWLLPAGDSGSEDGGSGGASNPVVPAPATTAEQQTDDALKSILRHLIEQEKDVKLVTSAQLSHDGDTVIPIDNRARLTVFRQPLDGDVGIGIGTVQNPAKYEGGSLHIVGDIYEIKLNEPVTLQKPPELTMKFSLDELKDPRKAAVYWYNDRKGRWEYVGGALDLLQGTISAKLPHFSKYALIENDGWTPFADMDGRWSSDIVYRLASIGLVGGLERDGAAVFEPQRSITRQEFAKLLVGASGIAQPAAGQLPAFVADRDKVAAWALPSMTAAMEKKWIGGTPAANGNDGDVSVEPQRPISRAEAATIIGRMLQGTLDSEAAAPAKQPFADERQVPDWARPYVQALQAAGLVNGYPDGTFRPNDSISREEAAAMVNGMLNLLYVTGKDIR